MNRNKEQIILAWRKLNCGVIETEYSFECIKSDEVGAVYLTFNKQKHTLSISSDSYRPTLESRVFLNDVEVALIYDTGELLGWYA